MSLVEIKDFNASIYNKLFFDQPVKSKEEASEKCISVSKNDDYTTGKYQIICVIWNIVNLLALNYQYKQIKVFLNKLSKAKATKNNSKFL